MSQKRTVSIADHHKFRRSISDPAPPPEPPFDEIDELAADPVHDHLPAISSKGKTARMMRLLDGLSQGGTK
jgi:hypothetical protein